MNFYGYAFRNSYYLEVKLYNQHHFLLNLLEFLNAKMNVLKPYSDKHKIFINA